SRDLARTAAFDFLTCIVRRSLEIDELVVAGVSKVVVEPDPFRRMQDGFGSKRPAFEVELLEFVPVALDHNVLILADPLDFLHRRLKLEQTQIVQRAKRDHQIEMLVPEGVSVLCAIAEQIGLDVIAGFRKTMSGNVKTGDLQVGQDLFHFVEQESLAATHVENSRPVLEAVDIDQRLRYGGPASLDEFVPTITISSVAVPIVVFVFL